jgi:hypothetical protein
MENKTGIDPRKRLLNLRDEGKISDEDFLELSAAINQPCPQTQSNTAAKRRLAIASFCLMLSGLTINCAVLYSFL